MNRRRCTILVLLNVVPNSVITWKKITLPRPILDRNTNTILIKDGVTISTVTDGRLNTVCNSTLHWLRCKKQKCIRDSAAPVTGAVPQGVRTPPNWLFHQRKWRFCRLSHMYYATALHTSLRYRYSVNLNSRDANPMKELGGHHSFSIDTLGKQQWLLNDASWVNITPTLYGCERLVSLAIVCRSLTMLVKRMTNRSPVIR